MAINFGKKNNSEKIKGWEKINNTNKLMLWKQKEGFYPSTGRPQQVELKKVDNLLILNYGVYDTSFKEEELKEAKKFAIDWMKSHPEG